MSPVARSGLALLLAACLVPLASAAVDGEQCPGSQYFDQLTRDCASCDLRCSKPPKACIAHCNAPPTGRPSAVLIGGLVAGMSCLVLLVVLGVMCRARISGIIQSKSSAGHSSNDAGNNQETATMIVNILSSTAAFTPVQDTEVFPTAVETSLTTGSQESTNWLETPSELVVR